MPYAGESQCASQFEVAETTQPYAGAVDTPASESPCASDLEDAAISMSSTGASDMTPSESQHGSEAEVVEGNRPPAYVSEMPASAALCALTPQLPQYPM